MELTASIHHRELVDHIQTHKLNLKAQFHNINFSTLSAKSSFHSNFV